MVKKPKTVDHEQQAAIPINCDEIDFKALRKKLKAYIKEKQPEIDEQLKKLEKANGVSPEGLRVVINI